MADNLGVAPTAIEAGDEMRRSDHGFTMMELAVVVLIIGVLVGIAVPVFQSATSNARMKACYANQRTIEGAAQAYGAARGGDLSSLAGVLDATHPLIAARSFSRPPYCPSAPAPADSANPDAAHGAYTLDASGTVAPCAFGSHGSYQTP